MRVSCSSLIELDAGRHNILTSTHQPGSPELGPRGMSEKMLDTIDITSILIDVSSMAEDIMDHPLPDVTDAEAAILQRLWDAGPATVRQLRDALYPGGGPSEHAT